jgi:hypothetical protein
LFTQQFDLLIGSELTQNMAGDISGETRNMTMETSSIVNTMKPRRRAMYLIMQPPDRV